MSDRRSLSTDTLEELARNLAYILPYEDSELITPPTLRGDENRSRTNNGPTRVSYNNSDQRLSVYVYDAQQQKNVSGLSFKLKRRPDSNDMKLCKDFMRVFGADIESAPSLKEDKELWASLQQTRFTRVIGRFAAFATERFLRWIRVVENAMALRYEGRAFSACIFMTKQMNWVESSPLISFSRLASPIRFEDAILQQKWIRAFLRDPMLGLVGVSLSGSIVGIASFKAATQEGRAFAPHSNLIPVSSAIVPGTTAFVVSEAGDLYVIFPNGATFVKSQGRWRYVNYLALLQLFDGLLAKEIAVSLVRIILDLSYDRLGGLIVILDDPQRISTLVPDHNGSNRPNKPLRELAAQLRISDTAERRILTSGTTVDGAIVLTKEGRVLDVACMVGEPALADCQAAGKPNLQRYSGARSTAAWNASILGTAIKVSEDGPITVFRSGDVIFEL
jgi:hypothetical protein